MGTTQIGASAVRDRMKVDPDATDEVHELRSHRDPCRCRVTPVARFEPAVAQAVVDALASVVRRAHDAPAATSPDLDGIVRAQVFEEGDVYMLAAPFDDYFADRYLMDFYDVVERDVCSRMHLHTGLRFVRIMTGLATTVRVSSLSPFDFVEVAGVTPFTLERFVDTMPDVTGGTPVPRHNFMVPESSWVDMQVPRGVSHQFNAIGPNAVIDSVHPEESIETIRERMSGYRMTAQTIFLAARRPDASTCQPLSPAEA